VTFGKCIFRLLYTSSSSDEVDKRFCIDIADERSISLGGGKTTF
jgi:hypothetical protein